MYPNVTNQLVLFAKLFSAPLAFELADVVMKDFDVSLQLEKGAPRLAWTYFAWVTNFVQMSFLYVNRHLASSFELVTADVAIPVIIR